MWGALGATSAVQARPGGGRDEGTAVGMDGLTRHLLPGAAATGGHRRGGSRQQPSFPSQGVRSPGRVRPAGCSA